MAAGKQSKSSDLEGRFEKDLNISTKTSSKSKKEEPSIEEFRLEGRLARGADKKIKPGQPVCLSNQKATERKQVLAKSRGQSHVDTVHISSGLDLAAKGYTCRPVVPAKKAELLPVAYAMHGEDFAPWLKKLFDPEREAALEAIKTGIYIGWRCPDFKHDCIRVGKFSKCFCGHLLSQHQKYDGHSFRVSCAMGQCECKAFAFVPSRAEEVGEFWLQRRINYDPTTWRAKCKCRHTHEEHAPTGMRRCRVKRCPCSQFFSNFLCCACDKHWEEHETVFETADMRKSQGIPYGEAYLPFYELSELRNVVLTGKEDDDSLYNELTSGPYAIPSDAPSKLALQLRGEKQPKIHEKHGRSQRF